jgi:hypothetical protein
MRITRSLFTSVLSTSVFSLLLGTSALVYAQEQHEDVKPAPETARPEAPKPAPDDMKAPRQDEAKPQKPDEERKPDSNMDKPARNDDNRAKQDDKQAEHEKAQHEQRAADVHGGRIPDDKFRAHFGRQHTFVISHPTIVSGQPRFQYGGYWFNIVDAWPVGWAYTDQCYVDYIDGEYFLFDLAHPGVRVAIVVVG